MITSCLSPYQKYSVDCPGFVGIDWATQQHQICVLEGDGAVVAERQVAHSGAGIADLCAWLHELSGGHPERVHAGIEVPHGAVVEMLLEREVQVVRDQSEADGSIS